ncbi:LysM peptidoglycan-binding domain-containing protein [Pontimonas salivibrio]|uniref:LysM peptidoglycan-binding domain-containing protein n=1 Tax=Pontimonas salivibrio TaxID=1159327 RepID=UPI00131A0189|nr:LysM peptidoglycan-binding domain-containing protein [Pontimonas salivibrio]
MKRFVLSAAGLLLGVLVAVGGYPLSGLSAPSAYASEPTPDLQHAATNGTTVVGADSEGTLWWSDGDGADGTWVDSGVALGKNGVTSLMWTGERFIATSFFSFARSDDGKDWTIRVFPLGEAFDPGDIISDEEFFQRGSMSADEIQDFLDSKISNCRDDYVCLNEFTEDTFDRDQTALCQAYDGKDDETAAQILYKVSEACGVAVEVLIVLLQKEMGLVTHTWPSSWRFDKATGYACPDTAPCDERYFGFYNQVYNAAKQFKRYANPPGTSRFFTWYPVGKQSNVRWHPRSSCGTSPVTIKNQATAGLYYYTPYAPNDAAMVNLTGTGDSCSSYGNRNFWRLYNYWFNPTKEFGTYITSYDDALLAVDGDGYLARSTDGVNWLRVGRVPDVGGANRIAQFGQTDEGRLAVLTAKGEAFHTDDMDDWDSLEIVQTSAPQTFVTNHTVASGDTVWAIASRNGVSVSKVVEENNLPGDGSFIRIGQQLTITKTGEVPQFESPIEPHASHVSLSSLGIEDQAATTVSDDSGDSSEDSSSEDTSSEDTSSDDSGSEESSEESSSSANRVLQPLVTQQGDADKVYVVKRGDTLIRIAYRNGTTVSKLRDDNNIRNVNFIVIGQRLIVGSDSQEQKFHKVEAGDTVSLIAELRDVSTTTILALNSDLQSNSTLDVGSLVRVE